MLKYSGLKAVLKRFDDNGWRGCYRQGPWSIANGGYDLWFELYYEDTCVARCVAKELEIEYDGEDAIKLQTKILEVYSHLKVQTFDEPLEYHELSKVARAMVDSIDEENTLYVNKNSYFKFPDQIELIWFTKDIIMTLMRYFYSHTDKYDIEQYGNENFAISLKS